MSIARRATVHGHVQGVFFRDSTRTRARDLGLAGWARNTPEGTVEVHVQGDEDAVHELLGFLREGSPQARVERVDVEEAEPEDVQAFDVR